MNCVFCKCVVDNTFAIHGHPICTDCFVTYKALYNYDKESDSDSDTDSSISDSVSDSVSVSELFKIYKESFDKVLKELTDRNNRNNNSDSSSDSDSYYCNIQ